MTRETNTTLIKQYKEMKKKHPDTILLFRVGDFYEIFSDDAIVASEILDITLTRRYDDSTPSVELAGFPHHALDSYLPKLVRAGKRVAICEQLEDPKPEVKEKQSKIYGANGVDFSTLKPENLVAAFKATIPANLKNAGKCTNKKSSYEIANYIYLQPSTKKLVATDSTILTAADIECSGFWPEDELFVCALDNNSLAKFAGHEITVAVYDQNGSITTIALCDDVNSVISSCAVRSNFKFPEWTKVIPKLGLEINIQPDSIKPLREWLKKHCGSLTNKNNPTIVTLHLNKEVSTIEISMQEDCDGKLNDIPNVEPRTFNLTDAAKVDALLSYSAPLFYLSVEGDFSGKILLTEHDRPIKFTGEQRVSVLMPKHYEHMYFNA